MSVRYPRNRKRDYEAIPWNILLTKGEVIQKYEKSDSTIMRLIKQGVIRRGIDCFKVGNTWAFDARRLDFIFNEPKEEAIKREKYLKTEMSKIPDIDKYSVDQKERIRFAIEDNIDLDIILNSEYSLGQMGEIITGVLHNIDVSVYANDCFDKEQMAYIRKGLEDGFDVSLYAKPEIKSNKMYYLYKMLKYDVDITEFCKEEYDSWKLANYYFYASTGYPITDYADPKYDYNMVSLVGCMLMCDKDPSVLKGIYLSEYEINKLLGLRGGSDKFDKELKEIVKKYA